MYGETSLQVLVEFKVVPIEQVRRALGVKKCPNL